MHESEPTWHISEVLTVATGVIVRHSGETRVAELKDHIAGRALSADDKLRYGGDLQATVSEQYPELADFGEDDIPEEGDSLESWLKELAGKYGEFLRVRPLPVDHPAHTTPALPVWGDWLAFISRITEEQAKETGGRVLRDVDHNPPCGPTLSGHVVKVDSLIGTFRPQL